MHAENDFVSKLNEKCHLPVSYIATTKILFLKIVLTNPLITLPNPETCSMKHFLSFLFIICSTYFSIGQHFVPKDDGSEVKFRIKNFGVNVSGTFKGLEGKISFDSTNLSNTHFDVSVQTNTINTGIDQRDNHLQQEEYFDVKKYPTIHFVSTSITTSTNKDYLFVFGKLTIKEVTKEISFPFKAVPKGEDLLFEGEFTLNRRDYNVGGGSITMSDNLIVQLSVLGKKQ